jgi:hypothetical protein
MSRTWPEIQAALAQDLQDAQTYFSTLIEEVGKLKKQKAELEKDIEALLPKRADALANARAEAMEEELYKPRP